MVYHDQSNVSGRSKDSQPDSGSKAAVCTGDTTTIAASSPLAFLLSAPRCKRRIYSSDIDHIAYTQCRSSRKTKHTLCLQGAWQHAGWPLCWL